MADRVPVSIVIGGALSRDLLPQFIDAILMDDAALNWEGTPFEESVLSCAAPLALFACEVAWGRFDTIEDFCAGAGLSFVRWSGGSSGNFEPERVIVRGGEDALIFTVTDDDEIVIGLDTVRRLGTMAAIERYFSDAAWQPPVLTIVDLVPAARAELPGDGAPSASDDR